MFGCVNVTTNASGIPYLRVNDVTVGTEYVDLSVGFRRIPAIGYMTINMSEAIPTGTTGTLPIRVKLNGNTRDLVSFDGTAVTAADLTGTGVFTVFYDWYSGTLQLISAIA